MKSVGQKIAEILEEKDMTQRHLATLSEVTEVTICRYIKGTRQPKSDILAKIATALGTSVDYLLNNEENDYSKATQPKKNSSSLDTSNLGAESKKALEEYLKLLELKEMQERNAKNNHDNLSVGN